MQYHNIVLAAFASISSLASAASISPGELADNTVHVYQDPDFEVHQWNLRPGDCRGFLGVPGSIEIPENMYCNIYRSRLCGGQFWAQRGFPGSKTLRKELAPEPRVVSIKCELH